MTSGHGSGRPGFTDSEGHGPTRSDTPGTIGSEPRGAAGTAPYDAGDPFRTGAVGQGLGLDTLVRLQRRRSVPDAPRRLALPDGMTAPLGRDAVALPDRLGPLVASRLPRLGCVYTDGACWWWIVPSDSDYALPWPSPAHYSPGALVTGTARLIHRPEGTVPYTPPIPLYLALCRVTGTTPDWSRAQALH